MVEQLYTYSYIFLASLVLVARWSCCYFFSTDGRRDLYDFFLCLFGFFFNNTRSSFFNHGESFALRALHCAACLLTAERKWSFNLDRVLRLMRVLGTNHRSQLVVLRVCFSPYQYALEVVNSALYFSLFINFKM